MSVRTALKLLALGVALAVSLGGSATAHTTQNDGPIRITWGMLDEPATTETKSGLDLIVRWHENATGIPGVHNTSDVTVQLLYGEEALDVELVPQHGREAEGRYTHGEAITLSRPGVYTLVVRGTIAGNDVDLTIPANHEVHPLSDTYFPPREDAQSGDTSALEARLATLEQEVAALKAQQQTQATTPATLTPQTSPEEGSDAPAAGVLIAAVGFVAAALLARRT